MLLEASGGGNMAKLAFAADGDLRRAKTRLTYISLFAAFSAIAFQAAGAAILVDAEPVLCHRHHRKNKRDYPITSQKRPSVRSLPGLQRALSLLSNQQRKTPTMSKFKM
jgi:hypothetical protein